MDAVTQLQAAAADILTLVGYVDGFSDWWLEMDTMLGAVEKKSDELRPERVVKLRVVTVKKGWAEVKDMYLEYKVKVRGILGRNAAIF